MISSLIAFLVLIKKMGVHHFLSIPKRTIEMFIGAVLVLHFDSYIPKI